MAALYADVGKSAEDLLKDGFSGSSSSFDTEFNAKGNDGVKFQVTTATNAERGVNAVLKPTIPFNCDSCKGEVKVTLSTTAATKVEASSTFNALAGFKAKAGFSDSNVNGGFDYTSETVFSNFKLDYPVGGSQKPVSVEAASVVAHGKFSFGGKVVYLFGGSRGALPDLEGKFAVTNADYNVVLTGKRDGKNKNVALALAFFHRLNENRSVASKASFTPGPSFVPENVQLQFALSQKLHADTTLKARYSTTTAEQKSSAGVALLHKLNNNVNVELGTEFPTSLNGASVYNVKFVFNQ